MRAVNAEKSKIETAQRQLRAQGQHIGAEWERRYFRRVRSDPHLAALFAKVGMQVEPEDTGGIWHWDAKKYDMQSKS